jgi:hypothetical protein
MCLLCGTPDPSHDLMLLRAAMLTAGGGVILAPRELRRRLSRQLRRSVPARFRHEPRQPTGEPRAHTGGTIIEPCRLC